MLVLFFLIIVSLYFCINCSSIRLILYSAVSSFIGVWRYIRVIIIIIIKVSDAFNQSPWCYSLVVVLFFVCVVVWCGWVWACVCVCLCVFAPARMCVCSNSAVLCMLVDGPLNALTIKTKAAA